MFCICLRDGPVGCSGPGEDLLRFCYNHVRDLYAEYYLLEGFCHPTLRLSDGKNECKTLNLWPK